MSYMKTHTEIYDFMQANSLMVLSSIHANGTPQSAVVGFSQTENLELVFGTSKLSRKAANLQANPHVSAVIGWDTAFPVQTLQFEGTARLLSGPEAEQYADAYYVKNPHAAKNRDDPNQQYYLVQPSWLRHTTLSQKPWDITELTF